MITRFATGCVAPRLAFPRDPASIADAAERVASLGREAGCPEAEAFRLQVCLAEVLNNLYEHGAVDVAVPGRDWVELQARFNTGSWRITLLENSNRMAQLPDPRLPEADAESGRGLFILDAWLHRMQVRRPGRRNCWILENHF